MLLRNRKLFEGLDIIKDAKFRWYTAEDVRKLWRKFMQPILYNTVSKAVSDYFVAKILCFLLQCSHTAIVWGLFWKPVERITARNLPWDQSWDQSWSGTRRGSLLTTSGWGGNDGFTRWAEQIVLWWEELLSSVCFVSDTMWESFMAALIYCPMKQINGEEIK